METREIIKKYYERRRQMFRCAHICFYYMNEDIYVVKHVHMPKLEGMVLNKEEFIDCISGLENSVMLFELKGEDLKRYMNRKFFDL